MSESVITEQCLLTIAVPDIALVLDKPVAIIIPFFSVSRSMLIGVELRRGARVERYTLKLDNETAARVTIPSGFLEGVGALFMSVACGISSRIIIRPVILSGFSGYRDCGMTRQVDEGDSAMKQYQVGCVLVPDALPDVDGAAPTMPHDETSEKETKKSWRILKR